MKGVKAVSWGMARAGLSEEMAVGLRFEAHSEPRREYFSLRNP